MERAFAPRRWHSIVAFLTFAFFIAAHAHADPAGRIGRIAWLTGSIFLNNPNTGEANAALLNQPLTSNDVLTTDADSRAEIEIGSITVRLDSASRLEFEQIDDTHVRTFLKDGRAIVKLPSGEAVNDFSLETRDGRFNARDTGIYRFDTDANSSVATVFYGALHFEANDSALNIGAGQRTQVWFDGQTTRYRQLAATNDDFTQWSAARDQRPRANTFARYVSPEMTGAQDLDAYGNWLDTPEYGAIWFPRSVSADWAPYRTGQWVWVEPWGWNWVGYEPWGFAPFHYGRWVRHRGMWGWVPGQRIARPVYAPAMVAWIGTPGGGISFSIGTTPRVGWFPLAPREVYVPSYRSSVDYVRNINITHVSHIANVTTIVSNPQAVVQQTRYVHRELPQALSTVPAEAFNHRRPVAPAALSPRDFRTLQKQPLQVTAPVAAPRPVPQIETKNRQERLERPSQQNPSIQTIQPPPRREREPQTPSATVASPTPATPRGHESVSPSPASPPQVVAPVAVPPRGEKPAPEIAHPTPAPQLRQEPFEPRTQERRGHEDPAVRSPQSQAVVPVASPPRSEKPAPEITRPTPAPQLRQDEPRTQERPSHREEAVIRSPQREIRAEPPVQQQIRQAPPPMAQEIHRETPRETSHPRGPRTEERQRPTKDEQPRQRGDAPEKR